MKRGPFNCSVFFLIWLALLLPAAGFADSRLPPPDFPLLEAVKKGDVQAVRALLKGSASAFSQDEINQRGHTGDRPLSVAARNGQLEIGKLLVEHGAAVDAGKETGDRTPLIAACDQGHAEVVQYLIAKGADVNANRNGITPLLAASAWGSVLFGPPGDKTKTIRILLDNGADVNVQDESWLKTGRTPLMYAVLQGNAAGVQAFLAKGARLDLKDKDGETALSLAQREGLEYIAQLLEKAESGGAGTAPQPAPSLHPLFKAVQEGRLDKVKALIAKNADVNPRTASGSTPLMYAANGNAPEIVRALLERGADVNAKNGTNNTALIFAATKGHAAVVRELLRKKADVNAKNIGKGDALIYAVLNGKTDVVRLLLKDGAGLNDRYDDGKTALMTALGEGHPAIAKLLIAHKADVNAVDNEEKTALMIACEKGYADTVGALLKAGADVGRKSKYGNTALVEAILTNHGRIVSMLLKQGGDIDRGEALFSAVGAGRLEIVRLLLPKGANVDKGGYGAESLLTLAADRDFAIVKFLIARGADVHKKDAEGKTALMAAVTSFSKTNIASLKLLIDRGADVDAVNDRGETALILAAKRGHPEMVRILVEKGSALSPKDKKGKSAWTYAVEGANPAVAALLEKAGAARDYRGMAWEGHVSRQREEFIKIVQTPEEWSALWRRAFDKAAPEMDFENYVVACVFLGHSAEWLYAVGFDPAFRRGDQLVIPYRLMEIELRLSGPFAASGQYALRVFEKIKDVPMVLEEAPRSSRRR